MPILFHLTYHQTHHANYVKIFLALQQRVVHIQPLPTNVRIAYTVLVNYQPLKYFQKLTPVSTFIIAHNTQYPLSFLH